MGAPGLEDHGAHPQQPCYDCRGFSADAYAAELQAQRADHFSTALATVVVRLPPASPGQEQQLLLAVAYSTGLIRLFDLGPSISGWLSFQQLAQPCLCWQAHVGPVNCLAVVHSHGAPLLLSGGADGHLHAWRLPDLLLAAQPWSAALAACGPTPAGRPAAGPTPPPAPGLRPLLTTKLPPPGGVNTWGQREEAAGPGQPGPGVLCLAVDPGAQQVFLGASDGGVHVASLALPAAATAQSALPFTLPIATAGSHLAAVLCMDVTHGTQAPAAMGGNGAVVRPASVLATGGEDGLVRLWDLHARACTSVLRPAHGSPGAAAGVQLPGSTPAAALLPALRASPPVVSLRFAGAGGAGAGWLLCGLGGAAPALAMWSVDAKVVARRVPLPVSPQVLATAPGEVLVAGNKPLLLRYTFDGELSSKQQLAPQLSSVFGMDVLPKGGGAGLGGGAAGPAPGTVVVAGAGGCVEVLSRHGARLALTHLRCDVLLDGDEEEDGEGLQANGA